MKIVSLSIDDKPNIGNKNKKDNRDSIWGHIVNVKNKDISFLWILTFMYPNAKVYNSIVVSDTYNYTKPFIYMGKITLSIKRFIRGLKTPTIIVNPYEYTIDLANKNTLIKIINDTIKTPIKDKDMDIIKSLDDNAFYKWFKYSWVLKTNSLHILLNNTKENKNKGISIYDLFKVLASNTGQSANNRLKAINTLISTFGVHIVYSSMLTFIEKSIDYCENKGNRDYYYSNYSGNYLILLETFYNKNNKKINDIMKYIYTHRLTTYDKILYILFSTL